MEKVFDVKIGDYYLGKATLKRNYKHYHILELIDQSIDKWKSIVFQEKEDHGIDDCPLCKKYHPINTQGLYSGEFTGSRPCTNCPIEIYTGKSGCENTPYGEFRNTFHYSMDEYVWVCDSLSSGREIRKYTGFEKYQNHRKYIAAANHMLSFLYELRYWYITTQLKGK